MLRKSSITGTFFDLDRALKAAHRRVQRLATLERRINRIAMPFMAAIVQEGVRLHMAGRENPRGWKRLLDRHEINVKADALSPCHSAAKLVFANAPKTSVGRYAAAMGWAWERVKSGAIPADQIGQYVVREGGVTAIALAYLEQHGKGPNRGISRGQFEAILDDLPELGLITVRDPDIEVGEAALAVIRRDQKGRFRVTLVDQDPQRVRQTVMRFARRNRTAKTA
jgi:hypothetical protein